MAQTELVYAVHRSLALAQRHARRLGGVIVARRRADGAYSKRGRHFTFRVKRWKGVEIVAGYAGRDNSFSMTVIINTHRPISRYNDDQLADLVEKLAQQGHFDDSPNNPTADLRWTFFNSWEVTRRDVRIKKGHARLTHFDRRPPGSLP